jgi:hypothetical protein
VAQIRQLIERRVDLCFVYSSESPAYLNYRRLLRREVRPALAARRARLEVLRHTDHVFTPAAAQAQLLAALASWAQDVAARGAV